LAQLLGQPGVFLTWLNTNMFERMSAVSLLGSVLGATAMPDEAA
jgi:hypothetical protein